MKVSISQPSSSSTPYGVYITLQYSRAVNAERPQFGRRRHTAAGQSESTSTNSQSQRPLIRRRRVTTTKDTDMLLLLSIMSQSMEVLMLRLTILSQMAWMIYLYPCQMKHTIYL